MFSKSRINEPGTTKPEGDRPKMPDAPKSSMDYTTTSPKGKAGTSILSADLTVVGNLKTSGDIQVEGTVEGDIRAHLLTVGETATIRGEIMADDIVVNGRVIGRVRGLKVRLTSTARVEGDINCNRIRCAFRRVRAASGRSAGHQPPGPSRTDSHFHGCVQDRSLISGDDRPDHTGAQPCGARCLLRARGPALGAVRGHSCIILGVH
jgi:cytoskeletal protein CcmA (bactofilin family)